MGFKLVLPVAVGECSYFIFKRRCVLYRRASILASLQMSLKTGNTSILSTVANLADGVRQKLSGSSAGADCAGLQWELRVSRRVRYARLQVKPYGGLEVVIPPRFPRNQVPDLVAKHADWARRQLARQEALRDTIRLPYSIHLAFDNSSATVVYTDNPPSAQAAPFDEQVTGKLIIKATKPRARRRELRDWIRHRAWQSFPPLLEKVSLRTGLNYKKLSIRSQKTRWGSCSTRGTISLNDQLMFLPLETVEYLMIHELCHTRHLNHSRAFWSLVEHHCPNYREHEKQLSKPADHVPAWFLLDLYS